MSDRRAVHPLLLEPSYWRNRLQELDSGDAQVVWTPRPDLSGAGQEIKEFRIRGHDGTRLWGLYSCPTWRPGPWSAAVRSVGPASRPLTCPEAARAGTAEFVFQEPAGRRLADRVLDVMQVCRVALNTKGIADVEVHDRATLGPEVDAASGQRDMRCNDELLIVEQLLSRRIARVSPEKRSE